MVLDAGNSSVNTMEKIFSDRIYFCMGRLTERKQRSVQNTLGWSVKGKKKTKTEERGSEIVCPNIRGGSVTGERLCSVLRHYVYNNVISPSRMYDPGTLLIL